MSLLVIAGICGAAYYNYRYCYYATWIYETVTPTRERLKVELVAHTRYGRVFRAFIENIAKEEEPVGIRVISRRYPASLHDGTFQDALVYRDPADGRAIVATVGNTNVWLSESVAVLLSDQKSKPVDQ